MLRPGRDKGLATPIPLGLAALATTTFLLGAALIFQPATVWGPYILQALLFGGLVELLAGMWSFPSAIRWRQPHFHFWECFFYGGEWPT